MIKPKNRIAILDSFRALAALSVVLFHFFSLYIPGERQYIYPYSNQYDYFHYGRLGVHFFFIISGFVIFFTLENTATFSGFWKKRCLRLMPSMIVASLLTFFTILCFDRQMVFPNAHEVRNFIPSFSFISPDIFNRIFEKTTDKFDYISGCYWSLWPEIQFYLLISLLYFLNRKSFVRNFLIASLLIVVISLFTFWNKLLHLHLDDRAFYAFIGTFNLVIYFPLFLIGALFYVVYKQLSQHERIPKHVIASLVFAMAYSLYIGGSLPVRLIYVGMFLLFGAFVFAGKRLAFLENKLLIRTGRSSYFLYLIHECIGILLIAGFAKYFAPYSFIFPVLLIALFVGLSIFYTEKVEQKLIRRLKKKETAPLVSEVKHKAEASLMDN